MCHDGTPLVYSASCGPGVSPSHRLLVEPGGVGVDVPEQVAGALELLDEAHAELGWDGVSADLRTVASLVFPADPKPMRGWWGGAWIGLVLSPGEIETRLYANLRWGEAGARWQRACDAICALADERLTPTLRDLIARVAPVAIPVGLGVACSGNAVRALRLYAGVHVPRADAIASALPPAQADLGDRVARLCAGYEGRFGEITPQSVTLGYDLVLDRAGAVRPDVGRTKVDVSCQLIEEGVRPGAWEFAASLAREVGDDGSEVARLRDDLTAAFGGAEVEFVSLSLRQPGPSASVYAKPANFRPLAAAA